MAGPDNVADIGLLLGMASRLPHQDDTWLFEIAFTVFAAPAGLIPIQGVFFTGNLVVLSILAPLALALLLP